MKVPDVLSKYKTDIDEELRAVLSPYRLPLYDMMRYHLGWIDRDGKEEHGNSGKALRPSLCLHACEAMGGNHSKALPAAAAVELIHNYSLIHDDIQDNDTERRHRPTVWKVWGKAQAINAGTAMRILANNAVQRMNGNGLTPERLMKVQAALDKATIRLIEGQYMDISFEDRFDVSINDYLEMIRGKTSALIACSMETGAIIGTDDVKAQAAFTEFGENLGMAFQVRDDILGIWGEEADTGKPMGSDIRQKKKSLPIIFALADADRPGRDRLVEIYQRDSLSDVDVNAVLDILNSIKTVDKVQGLVDEYSEKSMESLESIDTDPEIIEQFHDLIRFLSGRNH